MYRKKVGHPKPAFSNSEGNKQGKSICHGQPQKEPPTRCAASASPCRANRGSASPRLAGPYPSQLLLTKLDASRRGSASPCRRLLAVPASPRRVGLTSPRRPLLAELVVPRRGFAWLCRSRPAKVFLAVRQRFVSWRLATHIWVPSLLPRKNSYWFAYSVGG